MVYMVNRVTSKYSCSNMPIPGPDLYYFINPFARCSSLYTCCYAGYLTSLQRENGCQHPSFHIGTSSQGIGSHNTENRQKRRDGPLSLSYPHNFLSSNSPDPPNFHHSCLTLLISYHSSHFLSCIIRLRIRRMSRGYDRPGIRAPIFGSHHHALTL